MPNEPGLGFLPRARALARSASVGRGMSGFQVNAERTQAPLFRAGLRLTRSGRLVATVSEFYVNAERTQAPGLRGWAGIGAIQRGGGLEPAYRELWLHRQHGVRGAGRAGRLDRLAVPAALRFGRLLRGAARHPGARALADRAAERNQTNPAALPARHGHPRDHLRDRGRRGHAHRFHAAHRRRGVRRPRAPRPRRKGPRADAHGADRALRLRQRRAVGAPRRTSAFAPIAGPDALELRTPVELHGEDFTTVARVQRRRGRDGAVHARLSPFASAGRAAARLPPQPGADRAVLVASGRGAAATRTTPRRTGATPWCAR